MSSKGHRDVTAAEVEWLKGSADDISYARFPLDETNPHAPNVILTTFGPGAEVPPHTHDCNYFEYIIEGAQTVGTVSFGKGTSGWSRVGPVTGQSK